MENVYNYISQETSETNIQVTVADIFNPLNFNQKKSKVYYVLIHVINHNK